MNYRNFAISSWARKIAGELASLNRNAVRAESKHKRLWGGYFCGFIVGISFVYMLVVGNWPLKILNILLMIFWTWNYWVTVGNEMSRISVDKIIEWAKHVKKEIEKDNERLRVEKDRLKIRLEGRNGNSIH